MIERCYFCEGSYASLMLSFVYVCLSKEEGEGKMVFDGFFTKERGMIGCGGGLLGMGGMEEV